VGAGGCQALSRYRHTVVHNLEQRPGSEILLRSWFESRLRFQRKGDFFHLFAFFQTLWFLKSFECAALQQRDAPQVADVPITGSAVLQGVWDIQDMNPLLLVRADVMCSRYQSRPLTV